jgi:hypothetical protein
MINTIISYQDRQIQFNANVFQKVLDLQKANELFFDKMSDKLNKMKSRNNLLIVISIFILAVSIVSLFI